MEKQAHELTCTRRLEIDAAHRLPNHEGKCRNLHGHRYVIEVTATGPVLDDCGRVVDFSVLKSVLGGWLDQHWDHGTIVWDADNALRDFLKINNQKHYVTTWVPSAENMAKFILILCETLFSCIKVTQVVVFETPNCSAKAVIN